MDLLVDSVEEACCCPSSLSANRSFFYVTSIVQEISYNLLDTKYAGIV